MYRDESETLVLHSFGGVTRYTHVTLSVMMGVTRVTLIMSVTLMNGCNGK